MNSIIYRNKIPQESWAILFITFYSIVSIDVGTSALSVFGNFTLWMMINAYVLYVFWRSKVKYFDLKENSNFRFVKIYLLFNIINIIRGVFIADGYWDFKGLLVNSFALLIPVVAYLSSNKLLLQKIFSFYVKYVLPLFFIFIFFISKYAYGVYLSGIIFLLLFFSALTLRWKLILLSFVLLILFSDLGARSNVIKFSLSLLFSLLYYIRIFLGKSFFQLMKTILFFLPIILFTLAITNTFNVFKIDEYIKGEYKSVGDNGDGKLVKQDLKADTRTPLYIEVLLTTKKYNSWLIGRSPSRGNETKLFASLSKITGTKERISNEVSILNVFTWTGIVGVILYFLVFFRASTLAISYSNNVYSKIMGLFLAFRWLYAWVEDFNNYSLNTFVIWIMIGFCISKSFRAMTDEEVKVWIQGIFKNQSQIKNKKTYGHSNRGMI